MQSFRLAAMVFLIAAAAAGAADPDLERTVRSFAYAFEANDIMAFVPLAHPTSCAATDGSWVFVRSEMINTECITVSGYRMIVQRLTESEAQVIVDIEGSSTIAASGRVVPFASPWTLMMTRDRLGWNIREAGLTSRYLTEAFLTGEAEWQRERVAEPLVPVSQFAYYLASRSSEWFSNWERHAEAIEYAESLARQIGDDAMVAFCDAARSRLAWNQRDFKTALRFGEKGLAEARASGDPDTIAAALYILAMAEDGNDREDRAVPHLEEAVGMIGQLKNTRVALAAACFEAQALGSLHSYRAALTAGHRALDLCRRSHWSSGEGDALKMLGELHEELRHPAIARGYFEQAVELARRKPAAVLAESLSLLAEVEVELGDVAQATAHFREAVAGANGLVAHIGANVRSRYAFALMSQKKYAEAEKQILADLELARSSGEANLYGDLLANLSTVRVAQGRYAEALQLAREALAQDREKEFVRQTLRVLWPVKTAMGVALLKLGRTREAEAALRAAIEDVEGERRELAALPQSAVFLTDRTKPYHALIGMLVDGGRAGDALEVAERMRGSLLVDAVDRQEANQALTPDERAREKGLEARLASVNKALVAARERGDARHERAVRQELDEARLDLERFDNESSVVHAAEVARHATAVPFEPRLPARFDGVAVVQYVVTEERTIVFTLRGGRVTARTLPIGRKALSRRVTALCAALASRDLGYGARAAAMYRRLVAPVEGELAHAETIAVVPDGDLWRVPFQALRRGDGRYVVERWGVFYAASVTMLLQSPMDRGGRTPRALLAFGNPTVGGVAAAEVRELDRNAVLGPLPQAEREVRSIAKLYDRDRALVRTGAAATEGTFKKEAARYDVLHLATHGVFDDRSPMYSALVLAPADEAEDGLLETREILQMKLHARVAVLAACNTGRGEAEPGGGVIGLSWAFLVAGCPTTVVTQFAASDAASASLMIDFHRHLSGGADCVKALRSAQLAMLRRGAYRHPFYWAAFAVVGRE